MKHPARLPGPSPSTLPLHPKRLHIHTHKRTCVAHMGSKHRCSSCCGGATRQQAPGSRENPPHFRFAHVSHMSHSGTTHSHIQARSTTSTHLAKVAAGLLMPVSSVSSSQSPKWPTWPPNPTPLGSWLKPMPHHCTAPTHTHHTSCVGWLSGNYGMQAVQHMSGNDASRPVSCCLSALQTEERGERTIDLLLGELTATHKHN